MGIQFFETMRGEVFDDQQRAHHVAIDIRCASDSVAQFAIGGRARIDGTIRAAPWADGAACHGELDVRPIVGRRIGYQVAFTGEDGARFRLDGVKNTDPADPVTSMTVLHTVIEREGVPVARGILRFDMNTLPSFLSSWTLGATTTRTTLTGPAPAPGLPTLSPVDATEAARIRALAEATIVAGGIIPPPDDETVRVAMEILSHLPSHLQQVYRAALQALEAAAVLRTGRSFASLDVDVRRRLLDEAESIGALGKGATLLLGMPIRSAHFSRRTVLDGIGLPDYRNPVNEKPERWLANHLPAESLDPEATLSCDVVVIGSGAGGGAVAATLAEAGLAVAIVEEGQYHRRASFAGGPEERLLRFWRDGGMNVTLGNAPVVVPLGRMVGGSTAINSGTCYRTPDAVLGEWRAAGLPSDFEPSVFAQWLDRAEAELGVVEGDRHHLGAIADAVARGADKLGGNHGPLRRNAPGCDGQGLCVVGCPTGAKRSSDVSWIPRAMRAGAQLITGLPVRRLLMRDRRCVGIEASGQDAHGAPHRLEIRARAVVVACGTFHTPVFLEANGIRLPWLGRNLSVHPAAGVYARFSQSLGAPWNAIPQSYRVDGLVDERVRFEGFYVPPQIAAPTMPFDRDELTAWLNQWSHVGQFGFMVRDGGDGRVWSGPGGRPVASYQVSRRTTSLLRAGSAVLAEMMLEGGAEAVATGIEGVGTVHTVEEARAIATRRLRPHHFRLMGFHPLGTCRLGTSPENSVLDPEHGVWGTENLYVADGSAIPTSLGVNPQITIMAAALRAADAIVARLT